MNCVESRKAPPRTAPTTMQSTSVRGGGTNRPRPAALRSRTRCHAHARTSTSVTATVATDEAMISGTMARCISDVITRESDRSAPPAKVAIT